MVHVRTRRKSILSHSTPPHLRQVAILVLKLLVILLCGACVRYPWTDWDRDATTHYPNHHWDPLLLLSLTPAFLWSNVTTATAATRTTTTLQLLSPDHVWTYEDIDDVLKCNSREVIEKSRSHYQRLAERAKLQAVAENQTIYGTTQSPLFGFLIPKTGSNTQEYYLLEALAAIRQMSYTGCSNMGIGNRMYDCMRTSKTHRDKLCTAGAFGNHFEPDRLLYELWHANCTAESRFEPTTTPKPHDDLRSYDQDMLSNRSVCTIVFRDPFERTLAGFYEWHYQKSTNFTALELVQQPNGAALFPRPQSQLDWIQLGSEKGQTTSFSMLESVLTSCIVGVTEHMNDYVTALSRLLWIQPPLSQQSAFRARSRHRHGMSNESDYVLFRQLLVPHLDVAEMALWQLATRVAQVQYEMSLQFTPVIPPWVIPHQRRTSIDGDCTNCTRCTPPGYERFRWTSYQRSHIAPKPTTAMEKGVSTGSVPGREVMAEGPTLGEEIAKAAEVCIGPNIHTSSSPDGLHCCAHAYGE